MYMAKKKQQLDDRIARACVSATCLKTSKEIKPK